MLILECLLKAFSEPMKMEDVCSLLMANKGHISSEVMKGLLKKFANEGSESIALTLFNMCINQVFPKLNNKDIDLPSDLLKRMLFI